MDGNCGINQPQLFDAWDFHPSGARLHGNVELTWPPWIFADEQIPKNESFNCWSSGTVWYSQFRPAILGLQTGMFQLNIQKFSKPTIKQTHVLVEKRMVNAKSIPASGLLLPPTGPTAVAALSRGCSCHHLVRYLVQISQPIFRVHSLFRAISVHVQSLYALQSSCPFRSDGPTMSHRWPIRIRLAPRRHAAARGWDGENDASTWSPWALGNTSRKIKKGARKTGRIREQATELGIQLV